LEQQGNRDGNAHRPAVDAGNLNLGGLDEGLGKTLWTTGGLMMRVFVKTPSRRPCSSTTRRAGETGFWMKWRRAGKAGFWTKLVELILRRGIGCLHDVAEESSQGRGFRSTI